MNSDAKRTPRTLLEPNSDKKLDESLHMVRYWLANEDRYMSGYARHYLETTPFEEASNDLALIASCAGREPHTLFDVLLGGFLRVFTTAEAVDEKSLAGRKAGIRAALLLAHRHDPRCLAPLIRSLELGVFWAGAHERRMEEALILFLETTGAADCKSYADSIRTILISLWKSRPLRTDLSPQRTKLLFLSIDLLAVIGGVESQSVLIEIANAKTSAPGRKSAQARTKELQSIQPH